jgi:hypothetical protein
VLCYATCGVPQVVSLHLHQEVGASVTSATSLRTLVAASVTPTVTALPKVSMLLAGVVSGSDPCADPTMSTVLNLFGRKQRLVFLPLA